MASSACCHSRLRDKTSIFRLTAMASVPAAASASARRSTLACHDQADLSGQRQMSEGAGQYRWRRDG